MGVPGMPADVELMSFAQGKQLSLRTQDSLRIPQVEVPSIPSQGLHPFMVQEDEK